MVVLHFCPGSHLEKIDFRDLEENREQYDERLLSQGQQLLANPDDVLMYDGRTLHSTMPIILHHLEVHC